MPCFCSLHPPDRTGGALLTVLNHQATIVGDSKSRDLLLSLLEKSSVPFFEMIARWIYAGEIIDRYNEFMIQEHKDTKASRGLTNSSSIERQNSTSMLAAGVREGFGGLAVEKIREEMFVAASKVE